MLKNKKNYIRNLDDKNKYEMCGLDERGKVDGTILRIEGKIPISEAVLGNRKKNVSNH